MYATLADGQLAVAATTMITGAVATAYPAAGAGQVGAPSLTGNCLTVNLSNRSLTLTETIIISFLRGSASVNPTSRMIYQLKLGPQQSAVINNIYILSGDTLQGQTTDATTVDYVISSGIQIGATDIQIFDSTGAKIGGASSFTAQIQKLSIGPAPVDTYGAAITIDVTKSFHVIAASNTASAATTLTPSGAGAAGDYLEILTEADSSGTVTATFASTFHPSGTQVTTLSKFSTIAFRSDGTRWLELFRTTNMT